MVPGSRVATLSTMLLPETGAISVVAVSVAVLSTAMMGWLSGGAIVGVMEEVGVLSLKTPWGRGEMRLPVG